jgi:hypothetical protein
MRCRGVGRRGRMLRTDFTMGLAFFFMSYTCGPGSAVGATALEGRSGPVGGAMS